MSQKVNIVGRSVASHKVIPLSSFLRDMSIAEKKALELILRDDIVDCPENILSKDERIDLFLETFIDPDRVEKDLVLLEKNCTRYIMRNFKESFITTPIDLGKIENIENELRKIAYKLIFRLNGWDVSGHFEFLIWENNLKALCSLKALRLFFCQ